MQSPVNKCAYQPYFMLGVNPATPGARPQLIAVLALDETELPDEDRAHALRVFNSLLSTQEQKTDAICQGAPAPLTKLVRESQDWEVCAD